MFILSYNNFICEWFSSILYKIDVSVAHVHRFEALKKRDTDFEYRWRHLGEVAPRSGVTEFDWDSNLEDATTEKYRGK